MVEKLQLQIKDLQRQMAEIKVRGAKAGVDGILTRTREVSGVKVLAHQLAEIGSCEYASPGRRTETKTWVWRGDPGNSSERQGGPGGHGYCRHRFAGAGRKSHQGNSFHSRRLRAEGNLNWPKREERTLLNLPTPCREAIPLSKSCWGPKKFRLFTALPASCEV